jgi:hypothetical protein
VEDKTCLFDVESVNHLFLIVVAQYMWAIISDIMGLSVFSDFETMATWWLKGKRYNPVNVF